MKNKTELSRITGLFIGLLLLLSFCITAPGAEANSHYKTIQYLSADIAERFDLADFVGGDYRKLLSETGKVSVLKEKDSEIKIGNGNVSITAKKDGIITRVRLDPDDYDFCVEGMCSNLGTSDINYVLYYNGYVEGSGSEDGEWRIFTNEGKGRFVAYKTTFANVDQIYYGLTGYMPIKQK